MTDSPRKQQSFAFEMYYIIVKTSDPGMEEWMFGKANRKGWYVWNSSKYDWQGLNESMAWIWRHYQKSYSLIEIGYEPCL